MSDSAGATLTRTGLLADLTPEQREPIEKACRWRRFAPHEQIIDRQSLARDVFFVVEGRVRVVNYSLSGREVTLDDVEPGGHFGELAALDGEPRSASVMALTDSLLAELPYGHFLRAMENHWSIAFKVMLNLAHIVRASNARIMDLSTLAANNRVHAELLRQARAAMTGPRQASISPIPVHSDIAGRVSTTRETVARVLSDLARQGVVERRRGALVIPDVTRLSMMVEQVRGD